MKNRLAFRMYVILVITVLAVAASVYCIVYTLSYNAMVNDIRERADGVKDYILNYFTYQDFEDIGKDSEAGALARLRTQEILDRLGGVGNIKHLYIAREDEAGELVTTMHTLSPDGKEAAYIPTGKLADDLRRSIREGVAVMGRGIYVTDYDSVYTIYWPVLDKNYAPMGAVCMEFDVDSIHRSYRSTALYSLALSGALIVLFSIVAYLSMNKATEPFYKKLAYTDFLTGFENRMAFEQQLRECEKQIDNKSVTLLVFDINNLKTVNDTQGHKRGDLYLKTTADIISQLLGKSHRLYRIGGDEFASILVGCGEDEVRRVMDAIHLEKRMALKTFPFSCACGAATFIKGVDKSLRDLFIRADEAMYDEKKRQKGLPD